MKGTTHLAAGLLVAVAMPEPSLSITAGLALGAVLPDIDKHTSMVGQHIPILPRLIKHRTVTHGLLIPILLLFVSWPLALGWVVHLLLDMCNPEGVPLLWPFPKKFHMPLFSVHSGGVVDQILGVGCWAVVAYATLMLAIGRPFQILPDAFWAGLDTLWKMISQINM